MLCAVCGLLLTAAATVLHPVQRKNIENDRRKNILLAVDLVSREKAYTPEEISRIFNEAIVRFGVSATGDIVDPETASGETVLPIYLHTENNRVRAYIIPIESQGLWGKIHGYMALENDGSTIAGFTVYQHGETPGLGGEIEKNWFQKNFKGKQIVNRDGVFMSVRIAKGDAEKQAPVDQAIHYVDGISGATLTGTYLTRGLHDTLSEYEPVSVAFRKNRLRCRMTETKPWCEEDAADPNRDL